MVTLFFYEQLSSFMASYLTNTTNVMHCYNYQKKNYLICVKNIYFCIYHISILILQPLDFEDLQQRFGFNITIQVSDHGGESSEPYHVDYAKVRVRLRDINDNKPEFEKPNIEVIVKEDADIGTSLATFRATDADQGGKSRVR